MFLTKKFKEELKEEIKVMVREAVRDALTAEITWEKVLDDKTGTPLAQREIKTEDIFLPAFWVQNLKYHEGVYRGMRQTLAEQRDRMSHAVATNKGVMIKLEHVRKVFKGLTDTLLTINRFALVLEKGKVIDKLESALAIEMLPLEEDNESSTKRGHIS